MRSEILFMTLEMSGNQLNRFKQTVARTLVGTYGYFENLMTEATESEGPENTDFLDAISNISISL